VQLSSPLRVVRIQSQTTLMPRPVPWRKCSVKEVIEVRFSTFHRSSFCASWMVWTPRLNIVWHMSILIMSFKSSSSAVHCHISPMVSRAMTYSAVGIFMPPCACPAMTVTTGVLAGNFQDFICACARTCWTPTP